MGWFTARLIDWLISGLIDWLLGWLTATLIDFWLLGWSIDWLIAWLIDCLIDWFLDWYSGSYVDWVIDCWDERMIACSINRFFHKLSYLVCYSHYHLMTNWFFNGQMNDCVANWLLASMAWILRVKERTNIFEEILRLTLQNDIKKDWNW